MINFGYTLGFMDYAAFVVIVAIYFILTIYLNTRANSDVNKNQLESNIEWNVEEENETFLSVALSNIIKYSSWMILLGICSDAYENGIQFLIFSSTGSSFMVLFMNFIIVPVFRESEVETLSEYIEQRFDDWKLILFSSVTSIISHIFLISLSIYAAILFLNPLIDANFFITASITTLILVLTVFIGKLKTNKWTHVISFLMTMAFLVLILIKETINFGGFMAVWRMNWTNGNIRMASMSFNPKVRGTLWSLMVSGCFWFICLNIQRDSLKKIIRLKEKENVNKSLIAYQVGILIITILCIMIGMLTYATFPTSNLQLFPQLLMSYFNQSSAVTGIFISIIFISTYSNVSCELTTIRRIINENIEKVFHIEMRTKDDTVMRLTAIIVGILSIPLILLLDKSASSLLDKTISIPFTFIGCTFGILIIGVMIPWMGRRATFYGAIIALFMMIYYVLMAEIDFTTERKFVSNSTDVHTKLSSMQLNYITSYYYLPSTVLLTCINAFILSFIFGFDKTFSINPKNFAPFLRRFISHHQIIENANSDSQLMLNDESIRADEN